MFVLLCTTWMPLTPLKFLTDAPVNACFYRSTGLPPSRRGLQQGKVFSSLRRCPPLGSGSGPKRGSMVPLQLAE